MTFEEFVPSWRAKLQLVDFLEEKRPKFINVTFNGNAEAVSFLSCSVLFIRKLTPQCRP